MKLRNSWLGFVIPLMLGLLYGIVLSALSSVTGITFTILLFLGAYWIASLMLKYLEYYTMFHKILASIYALLMFIIYLLSYSFFILLDNGASLSIALAYAFSFDNLFFQLKSLGLFGWLILVVTTLAAFGYMNKRHI